ncbi:MAG: zinc-ribbon domain-containing protein [Pseudomonadota bacterium]
MPITCPRCRTSYQVPDEKIGDKGRRVKCIKCEHVWHARLDPEPVIADVAVEAEATANARPSFNRLASSELPRDEDATKTNSPPVAVENAPDIETPMPGTDASSVESDVGSGSDDDLADGADADAGGTTGDGKPTDANVEEVLAHEGLSDESADIIANVNQAMIEIENQGAAPRNAVKAPVVQTKIKVKKVSNVGENLAGIAAVGLGLFLIVAAVMFREPIVRTVPETARLYGLLGMSVNLRGLEFSNISTSTDFENGVPVLMVSGTISNVSSDPVTLPVVRLALRTTRGQEVYAWSYEPSVKRLASGEEVDFTTRVASPPDGASDIQLRFIGIDRVATRG